MTGTTNATNTVLRDGMLIGKLRGIQEELAGYRDYTPVGPTTKRGSGQVLPFVKGLYFSARIIYFMREVLSVRGLNVNWGHIIHGSQAYYSPECDIIIHKPGSLRWDGGVLDFHFVDFSNVVAVVSCKSRVTAVDADYVQQLTAFGVRTIGLVGEVCHAAALARLREQAKGAGYVDMWCLAMEEDSGRRHDENMLLDFIRFVEGL